MLSSKTATMDKWVGKVALITGASSGIGKSIVDKLVRSGMKVVACARREKKLKEHALELNKHGPGEMLPFKCDVTIEQQILDMFQYIEEKFGEIHVCINNAGVTYKADLLDGKTEAWQSMISTHVIATCIITRESYSLMPANDGHIININSIGGHLVVTMNSMYCATKFAVTAITEGLRQELRAKKSNIRTTSISPGWVKTDILNGMDPEEVRLLYDTNPHMQPNDIADAVVFALTAPQHMDINEITVRSLASYP